MMNVQNFNLNCTLYVLYVHSLLELTVRFQSTHYTGREDEGFILVILELIGGRSDYPFNVTVTPSEQSPVSAESNNAYIRILKCSLKMFCL